MKKHITNYESEAQYWADQPTFAVVLFGLSLILAAIVLRAMGVFRRY